MKDEANSYEEAAKGFMKLQAFRNMSFCLLGVGVSNAFNMSEKRLELDEYSPEAEFLLDMMEHCSGRTEQIAKFLVYRNQKFAEELSLQIGFQIMDKENDDGH